MQIERQIIKSALLFTSTYHVQLGLQNIFRLLFLISLNVENIVTFQISNIILKKTNNYALEMLIHLLFLS